MNEAQSTALTKVPEVTLTFWIIKIVATTLGETGGDAVTMSMGLGYLTGTMIFGALFVIAIAAQIVARRFHPFLYWAVIVATTTTGTTLADFFDRSLGIGYTGGSLTLLALLAVTFWLWHRVQGSVALGAIQSPRAEGFYWLTILFSQTLGTALGDWAADTGGLGFGGGVLAFAAALAIVAALYCWTRLSHTALFWVAFVLTRPLGATLGDLLDKPRDEGGMALSRYVASVVLAAAIIIMIAIFPKRAEQSTSR